VGQVRRENRVCKVAYRLLVNSLCCVMDEK
jgi:hypothetical protein